MVVKGIIKTIDFNSNSCTVRLPFFENAGDNTEVITTAIFSTIPGVYNGYKVGDVVFVEFENSDYDQAIVTGKLFLGAAEEGQEGRGAFNVSNLTIADTATIPITTKLSYPGNNETTVGVENDLTTYKSIEDIARNLQKQETQIGSIHAQIIDDGESLGARVSKLEEDDAIHTAEIIANADAIKNKVSITDGGEGHALGWTLTPASWTLDSYKTSGGVTVETNVLKAGTSDAGETGLWINGKLTSNEGKIANWSLTQDKFFSDPKLEPQIDDSSDSDEDEISYIQLGTKDTYVFRKWDNTPDAEDNPENLPEDSTNYSDLYDVFILDDTKYNFGTDKSFVIPQNAYYNGETEIPPSNIPLPEKYPRINKLYWKSLLSNSTQETDLKYFDPPVVVESDQEPQLRVYDPDNQPSGSPTRYEPKADIKQISGAASSRALDQEVKLFWEKKAGGNWNMAVTRYRESMRGKFLYKATFTWANPNGIGLGEYEPIYNIDNFNIDSNGHYYGHIETVITIDQTEYQTAYGIRNFTKTNFGQETSWKYVEKYSPSNTFWGFNSYGKGENEEAYWEYTSTGIYSFYLNNSDNIAQIRVDRATTYIGEQDYREGEAPVKNENVFIVGRLKNQVYGTVNQPQIFDGKIFRSYATVQEQYPDIDIINIDTAISLANELQPGEISAATYIIVKNDQPIEACKIITNVNITQTALYNYDGTINEIVTEEDEEEISDDSTIVKKAADPYNGTLAVMKLQFKQDIHQFDFYIRANSQSDKDYLIVSDIFNLPDDTESSDYEDYLKNCVHKLLRGQVCYNDLLGSTQGINGSDNEYLANYKKITLRDINKDDFVYIVYKKDFDNLCDGLDTGYILLPRTSKIIHPAIMMGPTKEEFTVSTAGELSASKLSISGEIQSESGEIGGWKLGYAGLTSYNSAISIQSSGNLILKGTNARLSIGGSERETGFYLGRDSYGFIRSTANFAISDTPKSLNFRQRAPIGDESYEPISTTYNTFTNGLYFDYTTEAAIAMIPITVRISYNPQAIVGQRLSFKITSSQIIPTNSELSIDLCLVYKYCDNRFLFLTKWKEQRTKFYVKIPGGWRSSTDGPVGAGTCYLDKYLPILTRGKAKATRTIIGLSKLDDTNAPGFELVYTTFISSETRPGIFSIGDFLPLTDETGQKLLSTSELAKTNMYEDSDDSDDEPATRSNLRYYAVDPLDSSKFQTVSLGSEKSKWYNVWTNHINGTAIKYGVVSFSVNHVEGENNQIIVPFKGYDILCATANFVDIASMSGTDHIVGIRWENNPSEAQNTSWLVLIKSASWTNNDKVSYIVILKPKA